MQEISAFDILIDYAKEHDLQYSTSYTDSQFVLIPSDTWTNKKYVIIKKGEVYFVAYDSYASRGTGSVTKTGVYRAIKLEKDYDISLHPKDWSDILFRGNKIKTDSTYINEKLTVCSANKKFPEHRITKRVVDRFLKLSGQIKPLKLLVKFDEVPAIPELKGKTIVGLETNRWIYQDEELEILLSKGVDLLNYITEGE